MQRSPSRKSTRLQTSASQDNNGSASVGTKITSQQVAQCVPTTTKAVAGATTETTTALPPQNIFNAVSEVQQNLPPLVPGPSVNFQSSQTTFQTNLWLMPGLLSMERTDFFNMAMS